MGSGPGRVLRAGAAGHGAAGWPCCCTYHEVADDHGEQEEGDADVT